MVTGHPNNQHPSDRLYGLLAAVYRMRDAERGYPLKALMRVIEEQVDVVEADIARLYENWFIETAEDWVVRYIGDLVGYVPVAEGNSAADAPGCGVPRALVPRREIANLIRSRRRKGTLALLELLAADVADWPARAVEFFTLLGRTQNINHLWMARHRTADLRDTNAIDLVNGPFDSIAHTVDIRRINSDRTVGRTNIPSVGLFTWRLKSYSVTETPAYCAEDSGPHCFTFSVLGQDGPLFVRPQPETDPTHIAEELNVPAAIRRHAFDERFADYYGPGLSLSIRAEGWGGFRSDEPVPVSLLLPADLTNWAYQPPTNRIAVDPVLGRLAFPPAQLPKKGVRVSYLYGFPADIGGGEYRRPMLQSPGQSVVYRVGPGEQFSRIGDAVAQAKVNDAASTIIEITASGVYVEPLNVVLRENQSLEIRAGYRIRPVLRMIDWQTDLPDALSVSLDVGSRFSLDGLIVTGRPVQIQSRREGADRGGVCPAQVVIRHCTLVPGWATDCDCEPKRPAEPSLELNNVRARVLIEHSILGSIQIQEDEVRSDPIPLEITDSIVDATADRRQAIGATGQTWAHAALTIRRSTVIGIVDIHEMRLGENSIFGGCVNVARRQLGCMRFCYVPPGCRTPRRYRCQPDGVIAAVKEGGPDPVQQAPEISNESARVRPQFTASRYGKPGYLQLAITCAAEITRGADDESEIGVYHDLFQPQREANLAVRLEEYTPAGMDVAIIFVN